MGNIDLKQELKKYVDGYNNICLYFNNICLYFNDKEKLQGDIDDFTNQYWFINHDNNELHWAETKEYIIENEEGYYCETISDIRETNYFATLSINSSCGDKCTIILDQTKRLREMED